MGHSIYLADDEKSIRELLHSFLASDGYTVRSFENGDALLEAFRQEPAELVILDIMMPGTDGLTVCRELRSVSDIPIILLTAKDSELDYVMGISQGSDDYLTKPFRPTIEVMLLSVLLFQDRFNGMIARKNALAGTKEYHVAFGEDSYTVVTAATTSTFRYELIDALAESQDYIILLMKKRYVQPLDKRTLTGGTVEEFKRFLEEKTGKDFRRVK